MSSSLLQSVETFEPNAGIPDIRPGDTVKVHVRIVEGNTERIQVFQGVVLRLHKGRGINGTFTVRRIASGGIGALREGQRPGGTAQAYGPYPVEMGVQRL